jgi:hypothetical protein
MVGQGAWPNTGPCASRQIDPAVACRKRLRGHGILEAKLHEDCLKRKMRTPGESFQGMRLVYAAETVGRRAGVPSA